MEHLVFVVALAGFDDLLCLLVGEAAVALDHGVHHARVQHFGLVVHLEDDRVSQLFFVGTQGTEEVAQAFGQHGNGAVYEVDGCGALLGFLVDDASFLDIVGHVGNVHAHFPPSVLQAADGEGIVKVLGILGVDGKGRHPAEVFAAGNLCGGNLVGNAVGGLLYRCRIHIGQAEFGQNGVHFGGVVARTSQDINHLTDGVFGLVGPFGHLHHGLVARLAAFELVAGNEDIVGQRTVFGYEEGIRLGHFECAHKGVVGAFQNLDYLALGTAPAAFGVKGNFYAVARHGMCRVAFGNEDGVAPAIGNEGVLAVAFALEDTGHLYAVGVEAVFVLVGLGDVVIVFHLGQDVHAEHLEWMGGEPELLEDVFQRQYFVGILLEEVHEQGRKLLLVHTLAGFLFFFLFLF